MRSNARRPAPRLPYDHGEPVWRCRYDVVAVVVFLIAGMLVWVDIPNRTHAFTLDLPTTQMLEWRESTGEPRHTLSPKADGSIEWNGVPVTIDQLEEQIHHGLNQMIEPEIVFIPDGEASYDLSARVLYLTRKSGVTKLCFGGLEEHRNFDSDTASYLLSTSIVMLEVDDIEPLPNPPACSNPEAYLDSVWP